MRTTKRTLICLCACAILMLTACQPTPTEPIVDNKGAGQLEEVIASGVNDSPSADVPAHGAVIRESFTSDDGRVSVSVDAEIKRMDSGTIPSCRVVPRAFSQEQADRFIRVLSDGSPLYGNKLTKEAIERKILEYKKLDKGTGSFDGLIAELEADYLEALSQNDVSVSTAFSENNAASGAYTEGIIARFDRGGRTYVLSIQNNSDGKLSYAYMNPVGSYDYVIVGDGEGASVAGLSLDEAKAQAEQICLDLNCGLSLYGVYAVQDWALEEQPEAYELVFTRSVDGASVTYDTTSVIGAEISEEEAQLFQEPWPNESLIMIIDSQGLQRLTWTSPTAVEDVLDEDSALLPFEEILGVFREKILLYNPGWDISNEQSVQIDITRIALGLARVQSGDEFYLVPVWDFYGNDTYGASAANVNESSKYKDAMCSMLTVNAMDGSIIDRTVGY